MNIETPKWLKRLQENSWEAEILISGGAIFTLFQIAEFIISVGDQLKETLALPGIDYIILMTIVALRGITLGFILHLVVRGFWISLVCLNSVYPNGINYQKLQIQEEYLAQSRKLNLTDRIIKLDHLSGLIFFGSFLFIIIIIGLFLWSALFTFILDGVQKETLPFPVFLFVSALAFLYIIDFFSSGLLRRNKTVSKLYKPVYWFFNVITLAFVYRPFIHLIFTNINKWKAGTFLFLLYVASFCFAYISLQKTFKLKSFLDPRTISASSEKIHISDNFYLDKIQDDQLVMLAAIQSDIIADTYVKIFIPFKANYMPDLIEAKKESFDQIVSVSINDSTYAKQKWFQYRRAVTDQLGIISYINISHLTEDQNNLRIEINNNAGHQKTISIPFWKQ